MTTLTSKVQYKHFEAGEFVDVQPRSYDHTIALIENFPWDAQRNKIGISPTNPSITIEGKNNDFLKLAPYYHHKYVLYYCDDSLALFTKSFIDLKDAHLYINNYFEQPVFDTADFKKEITWFRNNSRHFLTQDFRYIVTPKSARRYLLSTSGVSLFSSLIFLILLLFNTNTVNPIAVLVALVSLFLLGGGLNLVLFFNYYKYLKHKILIMSRGNDTFYFGDIEHPVKYNKKDLLRYTTIKSSGSRNPVSAFAIVKMEFKDGTVLHVPNMLVDHDAMRSKLFAYERVEESGFPFLRY